MADATELNGRPCDVLSVGDEFGWQMVNGMYVNGVVTEIDSNVVFIRDAAGREWAYES